jgi:hypothetical protein
VVRFARAGTSRQRMSTSFARRGWWSERYLCWEYPVSFADSVLFSSPTVTWSGRPLGFAVAVA